MRKHLANLASLAFGLIAVCSLAQTAHAASTCAIGLRLGTPITVDGVRDAAWTGNNASVISSRLGMSQSPCVEALPQALSAPGNITVYSMQYDRGGVRFLGMLFEVDDDSPCETSTCLGERISILLDPNKSRGAALENGAAASSKDYNFNLQYFYDATGTVLPTRLFMSTVASSAGLCSAVMPANIPWTTPENGVAQPASMFSVVRRMGGTPGYTAEIEIPLSLLGNPTADIGIAFAVINARSTCTGTNCFDFSSSFPLTLPITNTDNPIDPCGKSWTKPDEWATGFFANPPGGDVEVNGSDRDWYSEWVDSMACGNVSNTYYPNAPCNLRIRVKPNNHAAAAQSRNLLFLYADFGMNQLNWRVVELQEGVSIPPTITPTRQPFDSLEVSGTQLAGLAGHPCIRVYILPPFFNPTFDRARLLSIATDNDLAQMVTAYSVENQHWAQQNVFRSDTSVQTCPFAGCTTITDIPFSRTPQLAATTFSFLPSSMIPPVPSVARAIPAPPQINRDAPPVTNVGRQIELPAERLRGFGKDDVLIQVRAFGRQISPTLPQSRYNFADDLGGILQIYSAAALQAGPLPLDFALGNRETVPYEIFLTVNAYTAAGVPLPEVRLNTGPFRFNARSQVVQHGLVSLGPGSLNLTRFSFGAHAGANFLFGELNRVSNSGLSLGWDLEYKWRPQLALQLFAGRDQTAGDSSLHVHITHVSGVVRYYLPPNGPFQAFVLGGGGYYHFSTGSNNAGVQAGAGFLLDITSQSRFELGGRYHTTDSVNGNRANFATLHGGLRFRF